MKKAILFIFIMLCLSPRYFQFARAVRSLTMRSIVVDSPGAKASMRVTADATRPTLLLPDDILIRVAYAGVNRADVLQRLGRYPVPPGESETLGLEASGVVESVGEKVVGIRPGDRVAALLGGGGYAEFARVRAGHAMQLPDSVSLKSGAAIPEAFLTAYQLLFLVGDFQPGSRVLVHASASGVGTSSVQLANKFGGEVFGTAGSQEKCKLVKDLGAKDCYNYKAEKFSDRLLEATGGEGVDLLLDCVGGSHASDNLKCLATDARWILYGLLGGSSVEDPAFLRLLLNKRASLRTSLLRNRSDEYKAALVSKFSSHALPLFATGQLMPIIHSTLPMESAGEAHRLMERNANSGKILLAINERLDSFGRGDGEL